MGKSRKELEELSEKNKGMIEELIKKLNLDNDDNDAYYSNDDATYFRGFPHDYPEINNKFLIGARTAAAAVKEGTPSEKQQKELIFTQIKDYMVLVDATSTYSNLLSSYKNKIIGEEEAREIDKAGVEYNNQLFNYENKTKNNLGSHWGEFARAAIVAAGALLGAVIGVACGITAGLVMGGGVGSVVPGFGNIAGAIAGGSLGAVAGAIEGAGIGGAVAIAAATVLLGGAAYKATKPHSLFGPSSEVGKNLNREALKSHGEIVKEIKKQKEDQQKPRGGVS